MEWVITKDLISQKGEKPRIGVGTYATDKDAETRRCLIASPLLGLALPHQFRLKDDDGEIYYEGRSDDNSSEDAFAPLDWAENDAGCTSIEYLNGQKWEVL